MTCERDSKSKNGEMQLSNKSHRRHVDVQWLDALLTYSCAEALTYLFTYLHSWLVEYKTGNMSETVEDRAKVTINVRPI